MNRGGILLRFYPTDFPLFSPCTAGGFSWHFVHTQKEDLSCLTILILGRHLLKLSCSLQMRIPIQAIFWGSHGDSFQQTCKKIVRCLFNIFSKNCVSDLNSRSHGTKRSTVSEHGQLQAKARKLQGFQCLMQVSCVKTPIKVLNLSQNVLLCSTVSVHFLFFYSTTWQAQNWPPSQILSRGLWPLVD